MPGNVLQIRAELPAIADRNFKNSGTFLFLMHVQLQKLFHSSLQFPVGNHPGIVIDQKAAEGGDQIHNTLDLLSLHHMYQSRDPAVDFRGNLFSEFHQNRGIPGRINFCLFHTQLLFLLCEQLTQTGQRGDTQVSGGDNHHDSQNQQPERVSVIGSHDRLFLRSDQAHAQSDGQDQTV